MPALQIDTPAPSVPAQRISLFWYPTGKCIRNGGRDTLKANECFLSDAPPGKGCADRMGDSSPGEGGVERMGNLSPGKECADRMGESPPGKECADRMGDSPPGKGCADRMGDSPPGKEGQRGSAMPKAGNPAKRELDQPAEAAGKKRGIANVRKNSGSYMQSIYAENSVAGAKNFRKNF